MSLEIKALAITDEKRIETLSLTTPDLAPNEVLVKVRAVALCTLEQRAFKREMKMPLPFLGGHEVSGDIALLGSGVNKKLWKEGQRVAVRMLYSCGECYNCRTGHTNMCTCAQRKPVREGLIPGPGGLCDYIIVQPKDLFLIPDDVSYEEASLTEPLACCVHSVEKANIQFGEDVVVIGGGIMGINHVMLAKKKGARVIISEVDPKRRELALSLGADIAINPMECNAVEEVKKLTDGRGADVVFNTTAISSVVSDAIDMTGACGRMIQYSSLHPDSPVPVSPQMLHSSEKIITGSISPTERDFFTANRLISKHIIDMKPLIATSFSFNSAQEAFEKAIVPGTYRVIVTD